jgi:uncharacterized protein YjdB
VTWTSSDETVLTVAPDAENPNVGDVTPVGEGQATVTVAITNDDGTPVLEADGVTPFPIPTPVALTVGPGAAVGDALVLSE